MAQILATAVRVDGPNYDLSESPVWNSGMALWYFVDINKSALFKFNLTEFEGVNRVFCMTKLNQNDPAWKHLCAVIPRKQGGFVAIGTTGAVVLDCLGSYQEGAYVQLQDDQHQIRFNDVQCIDGKLVGGTIDCASFQNNIAAFGYITNDGFQVVQDGHVISNGLCISPDGEMLYHIESTEPYVYMYDRNPATGELTNRRHCLKIVNGLDFFRDRDEQGAPKALGDGMVAAMYNGKFVLCVAEWGLGRIGVYDPETEEMLGLIEVPVTRPTSLSFGGDKYDQIFITSERLPHDPADNCGLFLATVPGLTGFAPTQVDWP